MTYKTFNKGTNACNSKKKEQTEVKRNKSRISLMSQKVRKAILKTNI